MFLLFASIGTTHCLTPCAGKNLFFPFDYAESRLTTALEDEDNVPRLMKFVVSRSLGQATTFVLPVFATIEDVLYVLDT